MRPARERELLGARISWLVAGALRDGTLTRSDACEECGDRPDRIEGHHEDYSRPLDVRWLCKPCHRRADNARRRREREAGVTVGDTNREIRAALVAMGAQIERSCVVCGAAIPLGRGKGRKYCSGAHARAARQAA